MILTGRPARPWPERPVNAANKGGKDNAAPRAGFTYPRTFFRCPGQLGAASCYDKAASSASTEGTK